MSAPAPVVFPAAMNTKASWRGIMPSGKAAMGWESRAFKVARTLAFPASISSHRNTRTPDPEINGWTKSARIVSALSSGGYGGLRLLTRMTIPPVGSIIDLRGVYEHFAA